LLVYDMPTSLRFYRDALGFEIVSTSPRLGDDNFHWVSLRLGDAELMLNDIYESNDERPAEPDRGRTSAHGDTSLFFACPDVNAAYEELRAKGIAVKDPALAPYGLKQIYVTDPDGYALCFQGRVDGA
jgi:catechol 2,3-dioxygenase-like lactoylglutathione lyase family enzyme